MSLKKKPKEDDHEALAEEEGATGTYYEYIIIYSEIIVKHCSLIIHTKVFM